MKTLYLIGGAMGVGKTAVSRELAELLPNAAFLDGDWCWDLHPFRVTASAKALVHANIRACLNNFLACEDVENIVFCWVMHQQAILDGIIGGLERPCRIIPVSLTCSPGALRARLEKDIAAGLRQGDILERSAARLSLYDALNTHKLDTTGLLPAEAARAIAALCPVGAD